MTTGTMMNDGLQQRLMRGAMAGLAGGVVFGLMMQMMGMIGMIGALAGQPGNAAVGWVVHLILSAIIGAGFAFVAPMFSGGTPMLVVGGLLYGLVWWVLGPLLIMPIMMGMGPQLSAAGISGALPSLWGHLAFGAVTALAWVWLASRG